MKIIHEYDINNITSLILAVREGAIFFFLHASEVFGAGSPIFPATTAF